MNIRTCAALLLAVGLPTAVYAVDYTEIEPNETKANALANGAFVLSPGDALTGISTGTSTSASTTTATADTFLVKTTPAALGIYRHRLAITSSGANTATIRGLSASATGPGTTDTTLQTSSSSTTTPSRFVQWYGFGMEEQLYYRVTGSSTTTAAYRAELIAPDTITPIAFPGDPEAGTITISQDAVTDTAYDEDVFLFDSNFNVIAGIDSPPTQPLSLSLPTGTYYLAYGRYNAAAGTASGSSIIQGTYQTGAVLDFDDLVTCSSSSTGTQVVGLTLAHAGGTLYADAAAPGPYDVSWFTFTVVPSTTPTNPAVAASIAPLYVADDGSVPVTVRATVTPGTNPGSTFVSSGTVVASSGAFVSSVSLLDDGVAPDAVAGDNIFTGSASVLSGTPTGAYAVMVDVTDDQGRSAVPASQSLNVVASGAPGCPSGASTLSFYGVQGNGAVGDTGNSVVVGDFGVAGQINTLTISGRMYSNANYNTEARIRATAPDGTIYDIQPFTTTPNVSPRDLIDFTYALSTFEDGTGTWTFQFYESYNDSATPDVVWERICFAAASAPTNPTATGVASPNTAINDGSGTTTLEVTVTPGGNPTSTFDTTGSVTVTSDALGGTVTLFDNGVAPDAVAGDNIFSATGYIANGATAGATTFPYNVTDDQGRTATGNIAFTITTPPPACPSGLATLTFSGVSSNAPIAGSGNSIVTGDFGLASQVNKINVTGRVTAFSPSYRSEARVRATAPGGTYYEFNFGLPASSGISDVTSYSALMGLEAGTGTWTFEFYESYDDGINPDATWDTICFGVEQVNTPITATDTASGPVARDGVATSTLRVTVVPGAVPDSTSLAVVVDDSSIGGSGSLSLLDDGVAPDLVAGDNIFSGSVSVPYTTALGAAVLPYTVSDNEGRFFSDSLTFTVAEATGACCTAGGCMVTTIGDCLDVQGGTFAGTGTACIAPTALTTDGATSFEDISTTGTAISFTNVDDGVTDITLPFTFNFFGIDYTSGYISTNGNFQFGTNNSTGLTPDLIPTAATPNNALYVLWDDLDLDAGVPQVFTQMLGSVGVDARFIIQWTNAGQYTTPTSIDPSTFQIALYEDGSFEFRYLNVALESTANDLTVVGFENADGTIAHRSAATRETLNAAAPISYRANSVLNDTGVCGSSCPACAADYDGNGGVDGGDLAAFFADFEAGEGCADVDGNGGVDGGDLAYFFFVFEQGGC